MEGAKNYASLARNYPVRLIEVENAVHARCVKNHLVMDGHCPADQVCIASLGCHGKHPIIAMFETLGDLLICLGTQHQATIALEFLCPICIM